MDTEELEVSEPDTLDISELSDEDIMKRLKESQAGDEEYVVDEDAVNEEDSAGTDVTGDQNLDTGDVAPEVQPEAELIFGKYKTLEDAEKGQKELEALLARQAQELGSYRKQTVAEPPPPVDGDVEITDELINQAAYEEMDVAKALKLYDQRRMQQESKQFANKQAEKAYSDALDNAFNRLSKDIEGYWDSEKNEVGPTAIAIKDYAFKTGYSEQDLQTLAYDPVNGPKVIKSLYRDMQRDSEIQNLKAELKRRGDDVGKKIIRAGSGPKIMGSGTGAVMKDEAIPTHLTDSQITEMSDEEIAKYIKRTRE